MIIFRSTKQSRLFTLKVSKFGIFQRLEGGQDGVELQKIKMGIILFKNIDLKKPKTERKFEIGLNASRLKASEVRYFFGQFLAKISFETSQILSKSKFSFWYLILNIFPPKREGSHFGFQKNPHFEPI